MKLTEQMLKELKLSEEQKTLLTKFASEDDKEQEKLSTRITELEKDITQRDKELKSLAKNKGSLEELQQKLQNLQKESETKINEYQKQLKDERINNAINIKLSEVARDIDVVSRFIDKDKLIINEGKVIGIDEQLASVKEKYGYMFKDDNKLEGQKPGYTPNGGANNNSKNPFAKETFNLTEQGRLLTENPTRAKELAAAAGVEI